MTEPPPSERPEGQPAVDRSHPGEQLGYPFPMPPDLELTLCESVAWQVLERGVPFEDAAVGALEEQLTNEFLCCSYSTSADAQVARILDPHSGEVLDQKALAGYVAALRVAILSNACLDEVLDWLTFIDEEFVPVPRQEVRDRLSRIVLGQEEPWPLSRFWRRERSDN